MWSQRLTLWQSTIGVQCLFTASRTRWRRVRNSHRRVPGRWLMRATTRAIASNALKRFRFALRRTKRLRPGIVQQARLKPSSQCCLLQKSTKRLRLISSMDSQVCCCQQFDHIVNKRWRQMRAAKIMLFQVDSFETIAESSRLWPWQISVSCWVRYLCCSLGFCFDVTLTSDRYVVPWEYDCRM